MATDSTSGLRAIKQPVPFFHCLHWERAVVQVEHCAIAKSTPSSGGPPLFHLGPSGRISKLTARKETMRNDLPIAETMAEASTSLLDKALDPHFWGLPLRRVTIDNVCQVGSVQVCATVDVMPTLETNLRISFRGPNLSPMEAADLLEQFTAGRFPFIPNAEWFVEIDARRWIHFSRPYTDRTLQA